MTSVVFDDDDENVICNIKREREVTWSAVYNKVAMFSFKTTPPSVTTVGTFPLGLIL